MRSRVAQLERREHTDIARCAERYLHDQADPSARYASFDYCFNYFQAHAEQNKIGDLSSPGHMQTSCLQLGFYLASWGMFRGSAELLSKSAFALVPTIEALTEAPPAIWTLDVDGYNDDSIQMVLDVASSLRGTLPGGRSNTLVTKTMLGVFGCVPAFDAYFKAGFGTSGFGRKALLEIKAFHDQHAETIDRYRVRTWQFGNGQKADRRYTQAKVIDMIFFIAGGQRPLPPPATGP